MGGLYDAAFVERLKAGVESVLDGWNLSSQCSVKLLTVSENATFHLHDPTTERTLVARVHRPGYHTREEIVSELLWIEALRTKQVVHTPAPVPRDTGGYLAVFDDEGEERDVVAFEFMVGVEPSEGDGLVDGFHELGAISARLHAHSRAWSRPQGFQRKTWNFDTIVGDNPHWGAWQDSLHLDSAGQSVLSRAVDELRISTDEYGCSEARFGLIHADLRLANLLADGNRLGVIDFDDCGFGWFGYDFAAAISFIEEEAYIPELFDAWIEGYCTVAPLDISDKAMIPTLVMLRRIQLTAWIASHAETPTAQELGNTFTAGTVRLARQFLNGQRPFGV